MKSKNLLFVVLLVIVGLLSACAGQATQAPASQPTEASASVTEAATEAAAVTEPAAAATEVAAGGTSVSFASDVLPLLESRCVSCHGGDRISEGLSLKGYSEIMAGSENGAVVSAGDATDSLLAQLVSEGKMPKRGPKLTPDQVQLIVDWINQGALNN